jgi:hypothetical protein
MVSFMVDHTRQKLMSRIAFMVTFFVWPPWFAAAKE